MTDPAPPPTEAPVLLSQPHVEDVFAETEAIRTAAFPLVSADLLAAVLAAERDNPDSRLAASRALTRAVDAYLEEHPNEPAPTGETMPPDSEGNAS